MSGETDSSDSWRNEFDNGDEVQNENRPSYVRLSSMTGVDEFVARFDDDGETVTKTYGGDSEEQEVRFHVTALEIDGRVLTSDDDPVIKGEGYVLDVGQQTLISDLLSVDDLEGKEVVITVNKSGKYAEYNAEVRE
jgi:hypothetical protein